jgi:hypothetical protein
MLLIFCELRAGNLIYKDRSLENRETGTPQGVPVFPVVKTKWRCILQEAKGA